MNVKPLCLRGVSYSFGAVEVLRDLSLEVAWREVVAVVGPSGCGKTTLLKLLAGFYVATAGSVMRAGRTRMIHQQDGLLPWLTVAENIMLGLRQLDCAQERTRQLGALLELIRLEGFAKFYPHQLSGGMRQRVELARALAGSTNVLLMDEPFSSLDYQTRLEMRGELTHVLALSPLAVVLVTHDIEEAVHLADRVVVLSQRPARICGEVSLALARPRDAGHPMLQNAVKYISQQLGLQHGARGALVLKAETAEPQRGEVSVTAANYR